MTTPFGGYKLSGFGGHDKSLHAHDQYTETQDDLDQRRRAVAPSRAASRHPVAAASGSWGRGAVPVACRSRYSVKPSPGDG